MPLRLLGAVLLFIGVIGTAGSHAVSAAPAPLVDDVLSYEPPYYPTYEPPYYPTYEPPYASPEPSSGGESGSPSDNRVGYVPDEYFTLYCYGDNLLVWRGVPTGMQLELFTLNSLVALPVGSLISRGSNTVQRLNEDTYLVSGNNGNLAPEPGSKLFSMTECLRRNGGGALATPTSLPQPFTPVGPTQVPTADPCNVNPVRSCYETVAQWCFATFNAPPECAAFVGGTQENFTASMLSCIFAMFTPLGMGMVFVSYTRPKRKKDK